MKFEIKRPKFILFDYGGTLLTEPQTDFLLGEREVFRYVRENPQNAAPEELFDFGMKLFLDAQKCRELGYEIHEWQLLKTKYEAFGIKFDISYPEIEKILWDAACPLEVPEPCVPEMLDFLRSEGIRTGVISNIGWSGEALKYRIDRFLPNNDFEFVIASSDYGIRKPNAELFKIALLKTGLDPNYVWHSGDSFECDILGAHAAGITPIYYTDDPSGAQNCLQINCVKIESLGKLPELIEHIKET